MIQTKTLEIINHLSGETTHTTLNIERSPLQAMRDGAPYLFVFVVLSEASRLFLNKNFLERFGTLKTIIFPIAVALSLFIIFYLARILVVFFARMTNTPVTRGFFRSGWRVFPQMIFAQLCIFIFGLILLFPFYLATLGLSGLLGRVPPGVFVKGNIWLPFSIAYMLGIYMNSMIVISRNHPVGEYYYIKAWIIDGPRFLLKNIRKSFGLIMISAAMTAIGLLTKRIQSPSEQIFASVATGALIDILVIYIDLSAISILIKSGWNPFAEHPLHADLAYKTSDPEEARIAARALDEERIFYKAYPGFENAAAGLEQKVFDKTGFYVKPDGSIITASDLIDVALKEARGGKLSAEQHVERSENNRLMIEQLREKRGSIRQRNKKKR